MTAVQWTEETRKRLHGSLRAHPLDPADASPSLAAAWQHLCSTTPMEVRDQPPVVAKVFASLQQPAPPATLDPAEEVVRAHLLLRDEPVEGWNAWATARALVALWVEVAGSRFAVDLLDGPPPFRVERCAEVVDDKLHSWLAFTPEQAREGAEHLGPFESQNLRRPLWWSLRGRLGALDAEAFSQAAASCAPLLAAPPSGPTELTWQTVESRRWWRRTALVFAFARDEAMAGGQIDWFLRTLEQVRTAIPEGRYWWWEGAELLLAAAPDLRRATALVPYARLAPYSVDVIDRFGLEAKPILEAVLGLQASYTSKKYLTDLTGALKLLASMEKKAAKPAKAKPAKRAKAG